MTRTVFRTILGLFELIVQDDDPIVLDDQVIFWSSSTDFSGRPELSSERFSSICTNHPGRSQDRTGWYEQFFLLIVQKSLIVQAETAEFELIVQDDLPIVLDDLGRPSVFVVGGSFARRSGVLCPLQVEAKGVRRFSACFRRKGKEVGFSASPCGENEDDRKIIQDDNFILLLVFALSACLMMTPSSSNPWGACKLVLTSKTIGFSGASNNDGQFALRHPNLDSIHAFFVNLKLSGSFLIGLSDLRHIMIQLLNDLDYSYILLRRTFYINTCQM
ncbi:hypothetical protein IEQ34_002654 [Dendrobium chrysotoxum]|uniref:Uncharacterized protein n=1 Tax=Dendrobium chrysotoxum TaxID=161865 RepID=A0AAV7HF32_DENCH|nr:hypothetical protein IEQ34_002654 [Dendrobium chrysotoxum]